MLMFLATANEAIISLPVVAVLHRRMHRTLSAGPQERFGEGAHWKGLRPRASDADMKSN
jgi:hypothetical protein